MCEINPKHKMFFRLEAYTSNSNTTQEDFEREVMARVLKAEMDLNEDGLFRFHIHGEPE